MCAARAKSKEARLSEPSPNPPDDATTSRPGNSHDAGNPRPLQGNGHDRVATALTPSVVRVGRPEDATEVYRLLLLGHAENALFPVENARAAYFAQRFLWANKMPVDDPGPRGVIGVIGPRGGHLEAITMVGIGCQWYTLQKHLEEFIVYVDPDHRRGTNHLQALIDWLWMQAERTGLPLVNGILTNYRTESKIRLYERIYGKENKVGAYFVHFPKSYGKTWEHEHAILTVPSS